MKVTNLICLYCLAIIFMALPGQGDPSGTLPWRITDGAGGLDYGSLPGSEMNIRVSGMETIQPVELPRSTDSLTLMDACDSGEYAIDGIVEINGADHQATSACVNGSAISVRLSGPDFREIHGVFGPDAHSGRPLWRIDSMMPVNDKERGVSIMLEAESW